MEYRNKERKELERQVAVVKGTMSSSQPEYRVHIVYLCMRLDSASGSLPCQKKCFSFSSMSSA